MWNGALRSYRRSHSCGSTSSADICPVSAAAICLPDSRHLCLRSLNHPNTIILIKKPLHLKPSRSRCSTLLNIPHNVCSTLGTMSLKAPSTCTVSRCTRCTTSAQRLTQYHPAQRLRNVPLQMTHKSIVHFDGVLAALLVPQVLKLPCSPFWPILIALGQFSTNFG